MAVPTRPVSGTPIESAWGQVAHDTAVAQDLQVGAANTSGTGAPTATASVTFPRAFASAPTVVVCVGGGSSAYIAAVGSVTATTLTIVGSRKDGANVGGAIPVAWIAYGPRA